VTYLKPTHCKLWSQYSQEHEQYLTKSKCRHVIQPKWLYTRHWLWCF